MVGIGGIVTAWAWAHKAQKGHGRHERGCETRCLCATSEAYDQNDQGPIVVLRVSGGNRVMPGCMVRKFFQAPLTEQPEPIQH